MSGRPWEGDGQVTLGRMGPPDTALSACQHLGRVSQKYIHKMDLLGEMSKFPFCDHRQTTKDDKRR